MQVKRKNFTYPVLNSDTNLSTYIEKRFDFLFDKSDKPGTNFILKNARFLTDSSLINSLFDEGKIKVVCIVECSASIYRRKFELSRDLGFDIVIPSINLNGKVIISMFAYATQNFVLKSSNEFDMDYQGIDYEIDKYDILAANDGFNTKVILNKGQDNLYHSIFSIFPNRTSSAKNFDVDAPLDGKRIEVFLSDENYKRYQAIQGDDTLAPELFSCLLVPSLTYALQKCREMAQTASDMDEVVEHYPWLSVVLTSYKKVSNEELSFDDLKDSNYSLLVLAQTVLGNPISEMLISLENRNPNKVEDESDD